MLTKVLLSSRSAAAIHALQAAFVGSNEFECHTHVLTNGHADPLHNLGWVPDLVVLRFDAEHLAEISAWAEHAEGRPPLGIGRDVIMDRVIVDKNARIGDGARLVNEAGVEHADGPGYVIRGGIIVVPKAGVIMPGTVV